MATPPRKPKAGQPTPRRETPWPLRLHAGLARLNRGVALVCGVVLALTVLLVLAEIILRQAVGRGLGGSDEIAGYVMAGVAAWGLAYAMIERAHVRIDVVSGRLPPPARAALDLLASASTCAVAGLVAWYGWGVLSQTIARGSRANTPLETPLWIPQAVWFGGWLWLTLVSALLTACLIALLAAGRFDGVQTVGGASSELDEAAP